MKSFIENFMKMSTNIEKFFIKCYKVKSVSKEGLPGYIEKNILLLNKWCRILYLHDKNNILTQDIGNDYLLRRYKHKQALINS